MPRTTGGRSPVQENTGSTARDHLANERTYLAWVRTALAVIGFGIVIGKLVETDEFVVDVTGLGLIGLGAAMLVYAVLRFERVASLLGEGRFAPARVGPLFLAVLGLVIAIGSVFLLLA